MRRLQRFPEGKNHMMRRVLAGAAIGAWWYFEHRNNRQVVISPTGINWYESGGWSGRMRSFYCLIARKLPW